MGAESFIMSKFDKVVDVKEKVIEKTKEFIAKKENDTDLPTLKGAD